jgi:hypothetical protein
VRIPILLFVSFVCALSASLPLASAAAPSDTKICKQVPGPHASYLSAVSGIKSNGNTWTVLATGVACSEALRHVPSLLSQWSKAKIGAALSLPGYTCVKMTDRGYGGTGLSSGGLLCHKGAGAASFVFGPNTFTARETAPYTIAQIKAFFGIK